MCRISYCLCATEVLTASVTGRFGGNIREVLGIGGKSMVIHRLQIKLNDACFMNMIR